jgi:hypothetical protein
MPENIDESPISQLAPVKEAVRLSSFPAKYYIFVYNSVGVSLTVKPLSGATYSIYLLRSDSRVLALVRRVVEHRDFTPYVIIETRSI